MISYIIKAILNFRYSIMGTVLVITLISALYLPNLTVNTEPKHLMDTKSKGYKEYKKLNDIFGSEKTIALIAHDSDSFANEQLAILKKIENRIAKNEYIIRSQSIFTANLPHETKNGSLTTQPYFASIPKNNKEINVELNNVAANKTARNYIISSNKKALAVHFTVSNTLSANQQRQLAKKVEKEIKKYQEQFTSLYQVGAPYTAWQIGKKVKKQGVYLGFLSLLLMIVFLGAYTRSFHGAIIPTLTSLISIVWALAFMAYCSIPINVITWIVPVMLIAIGSTEDIHIFSSYLRNYEKGNKKSIIKTGQTVGVAVFLTFLTTIVGFFSITFSNVEVLSQFGFSATAGLLANFVITILLHPIYYSFIQLQKNTQNTNSKLKVIMIEFFNYLVTKKSWIVFVIAIFVLVTIGYGVVHLTINNDITSFFVSGSELEKRSEKFSNHFADLNTIYAVFSGKENTFKKGSGIKSLVKLQMHLASNDKFDKTRSIANILAEIDSTIRKTDNNISTLPKSDQTISQYYLLMGSNANIDNYVTPKRDQAAVHIHNGIKNTSTAKQVLHNLKQWTDENISHPVTITSKNMLLRKAGDRIAKNQLRSIIILLSLVFILFVIFFHRFKLAFVAFIPNLIPVVIMYGTIGWAGASINTASSMLGAVIIGVIVDDTIHMTVYYLQHSDLPITKRIYYTIEHEFLPVSATTLAIGIGFGVLSLSVFTPIAQFGWYAAYAAFLAFVADLIVLPALIYYFKIDN